MEGYTNPEITSGWRKVIGKRDMRAISALSAVFVAFGGVTLVTYLGVKKNADEINDLKQLMAVQGIALKSSNKILKEELDMNHKKGEADRNVLKQSLLNNWKRTDLASQETGLRIQALHRRLNGTDSKIGNLHTEVGNLQARFGSLESGLMTMQEQMQSMDDQMQSMDEQMKALNDHMSNLVNLVSKISNESNEK